MGVMYKLLVKHRNLRMDSMSPSAPQLTASPPPSNTSPSPSPSPSLLSPPSPPSPMQTTNEDELSDSGSSTSTTSKEPQFTAEHILQLCKFLAEKSKRNKELLQQQHAKARQRQRRLEGVGAALGDKLAPCRQLQMQEQLNANTNNNHNASEYFGGIEIECGEQLAGWHTPTATTTTTTPLTPHIHEANTSLHTIHAEHDSGVPAATLLIAANQAVLHASPSLAVPTRQPSPPPSPSLSSSCSIDFQSNKRDILLKIRSQILERKRQRKMACVLVQQRMGVWRPW